MRCSISGCKSDTGKKMPDLSFHSFPENDYLRQNWIAATGRMNWTPKPSSKICSRHFDKKMFIKKKKLTLLLPNAAPLVGTHETSTDHDTQSVLQEQCDDQNSEKIEGNDEFDYFARCLATQLRSLPAHHAFDLMENIKLMVTKTTLQVKEEKSQEISINPLPFSKNNKPRKRPSLTATPGPSIDPRYTDLHKQHSGEDKTTSSQRELLTVKFEEELPEQQQTDQEMSTELECSCDDYNPHKPATSIDDPLRIDTNNLFLTIVPKEEKYLFKVETEEDISEVHSFFTHSNNPHNMSTVTSTSEMLSENLNTDSTVQPTGQHQRDRDGDNISLITIKEEPDDGEYVLIGAHSQKR